jgi:hypothetical protein
MNISKQAIQVKFYIKAHKMQNNIPTVHISEMYYYIVKSNNLSSIFRVCYKKYNKN